VNPFDVRIHAIRRRAGRRRPFEVRWHAAGRARSRSFITRALADSYRAELVRAARQGLAFDPATGEPARWATPVAVTWHQHAIAFADMKWPQLAAHSRASIADALATVTPALTTATAAGRRPPAAALRAALYQHAYSPPRLAGAPGPAAASALGWLERASLPVTALQDPRVTRHALDALALRLDGSRAAANTITRRRAVFRAALGYAAELGLLPDSTLTRLPWKAPEAAATADPRLAASPAQVEAILAQARKIRPELTAFFGCLYYAALRPAEAIALRRDCLDLPDAGWGQLTLSATLSRSARAWTGNGTPHEPRGLNTARRAPSAPSRYPRSSSASCNITCTPMAPPRTGGCSAAPAAARYPTVSTAGSGTRPAPKRPARPATCTAHTTCGTPHYPSGSPPAPRPPRSPPAPGTAPTSCSPSTPTPSPATTRPPATASGKPSSTAPARRPHLAHESHAVPAGPADGTSGRNHDVLPSWPARTPIPRANYGPSPAPAGPDPARPGRPRGQDLAHDWPTQSRRSGKPLTFTRQA
jgi:integrase